ncbi:NAD(P)-binding domain-containing protein [Arthrobacter methylotrophus]|uniref:NADPH-dependent F420 reductase n=1 Tax=Arthrobacter methylotrophus TaxID=121291 RepID=A0ABV5UPI7_9MICC
MSDITIVGSGHMARAIGVRMIQSRKSVQIVGRNPTQTQALVEFLGAGATAATDGDAPEGGIVILALPHSSALEIVRSYSGQLSGKVVVHISNTVDPSNFDQLTIPYGTSGAEEAAALLPEDADLVKAFNTCFAGPLEKGAVGSEPLDVFIAGDSEDAKVQVSAVVAASGLRPIDVGPLRRARELEAFMLVIMGLQVNPQHLHFNWDTSLKLLP